jgi:hypothetical protein
MTDTFVIKRGNTSPAIERTLSDFAGPVNLLGATVRFRMANSEFVRVIDAEAEVTDAGAGRVVYEWQAEDTAEAGIYWGEFVATYADNTEETFPNAEYIKITVTKDI